MIGIIPSNTKTYEVYGDFNSDNLIEGKIYYHPETKRLYYYSTTHTRSNPDTGYFPIWNGKKIFASNFSNNKTLDNDVTITNIDIMGSKIDSNIAKDVIYRQRLGASNGDVLKPQIRDGDNMFTQCIKAVICKMNLTMIDLYDMAAPHIQERIIDNYYSALNKISFMRMTKWHIWIGTILHLRYEVIVFKPNKKRSKRLLTFKYPENEFDTGIVKYDSIIKSKDDPFKKIVKILMIMENINKNNMDIDGVDDYTLNNMFTTINGDKPLSAQIFDRFIRMSKLTYIVNIYNKNELLLEYKE